MLRSNLSAVQWRSRKLERCHPKSASLPSLPTVLQRENLHYGRSQLTVRTLHELLTQAARNSNCR